MEIQPRPTNLMQMAQGDVPSAKQHNGHADAINRILAISPFSAQKPGDPVAVRPIEEGLFQLVGIFGNYLTCYRYDQTEGVDETELIYVAKPHLLQNYTTRGSRTYSTFVNADEQQQRYNETDDETQVVVPTYVIGEVFPARRGIVGGTNTSYADARGESRFCEWIADSQGRSWAKKKE